MFKNSTNNCTNFKYLINCEKVLKCRQGYDGWKGLELIWCWWIYVMNFDEINKIWHGLTWKMMSEGSGGTLRLTYK